VQCVNTSKGDIIITRIKITAERVYMAKDDSLEGIAGSVIGIPISAIIHPGEKAAFPIVVGDGKLLEEGAPKVPFTIIISWRRTGSMWLPQLPVFLRTSVRDLRTIDAAM